ncbi:MAG: S8 family serine peptidase [Bacteroidia bacterium]|nr:S8 family serine peptidase [Bacteroidia bacterium]
MNRRLFLLLMVLLVPAGLRAQDPAVIPGEYIVMLQPDTDPMTWAQGLPPAGAVRVHQQLSARLHLYLIVCDTLRWPDSRALDKLRKDPAVILAQPNHRIGLRHTNLVPADPQFTQQWGLQNTGQQGGTLDADIDATDAWDLTTGGLTDLGDTVVIAVIDEGFDMTHPDLPYYVNPGEIPGNNTDDDNNGYVDDVSGWNSYTQTGAVTTSVHGTHVAGIAGARGNNTLGVSGVCWDARILPIAGASGNEAVVVAAYAYALELRARYNATNGAEGAFVVVTNSSFGINNANPLNYPIWCAMYDSLGAYGILSVVSTMNLNANVDLTGDVPTTCASDWMIAVTNTTRQDTKASGAAYSATQVDLGAPGTSVYSTLPSGQYGFDTGTSMAAPHVAGAIALMISHACPGWLIRYRNDPAATALRFKEMLLSGTDVLPALQGLVATGGRLNAHHSLLILDDSCATLPATCLPPYQLSAGGIQDVSVTLTWAYTGSAATFKVRYRPQGSPGWIPGGISATQTVSLTGLSPCTMYEFQVQARCGADSSGYAVTRLFRTEGCCEAPAGLRALAVTDTTAAIVWQDVFGAGTYPVRYRVNGTATWTLISVPDTALTLTGLLPCTAYEVQVGAVCGSIQQGFSASLVMTTRGCGSCLDLTYCEARGQNTTYEWLQAAEIGPVSNGSGNDGGYGDYTNPTWQWDLDSTYAVTLTPGFGGFAFKESFRIWIDLNQDGVFQEPGELVFDPPAATAEVSGQITLPPGTPPGATRMRVAMKFAGFSGNDEPTPCGLFGEGEVEDYCITLTTGDSVYCSAPQGVTAGFVPGTNTAEISWIPVAGASAYRVRYRQEGQVVWQTITTAGPVALLSGLNTCTRYEYQAGAECQGIGSAYSPVAVLLSRGCGTCLDASYCESRGLNAGSEWIAGVQLDDRLIVSGADDGYAAFTESAGTVTAGGSYDYIAWAGFVSGVKPETWRAWADWNQDEVFDPVQELIFSADIPATDTARGIFEVPADALAGTCRVRVSLKRDQAAQPCETDFPGEVEDYCLNVNRLDAIDPDAPQLTWQLYPNPAQAGVTVVLDRPGYTVRLLDLTGRLVLTRAAVTAHTWISLSGLPAGVYGVQVTRDGVTETRLLRVE